MTPTICLALGELKLNWEADYGNAYSAAVVAELARLRAVEAEAARLAALPAECAG
jgi:hypothetical protein